jgi:hypothetical protein
VSRKLLEITILVAAFLLLPVVIAVYADAVRAVLTCEATPGCGRD